MYYGGGIQFVSDSKSTIKESESVAESVGKTSFSQREFLNSKEKIQIEPTLFKTEIE